MDVEQATADLLSQLQSQGYFGSKENDKLTMTAELYDTMMGFLHAIHWSTDRWIFYLLGSQISLYLLAFLTRKIPNVQIGMLIGVALLIYNTETVNVLGAVYWKRFSSQNYFDENGVFVGIFYAAPLLLLLLLQLINTLYQTAYLLIAVKVSKVS